MSKIPSFLLIAVCCSLPSSSIPIFTRTLSLVLFSVREILCNLPPYPHLTCVDLFSSLFVIVHVSQSCRTVGKISDLTFHFSLLNPLPLNRRRSDRPPYPTP